MSSNLILQLHILKLNDFHADKTVTLSCPPPTLLFCISQKQHGKRSTSSELHMLSLGQASY